VRFGRGRDHASAKVEVKVVASIMIRSVSLILRLIGANINNYR
jgi:hypothetical protein